MQRLKVIFCGSGEFGLPTLRGLVEAGHEVVLVVSQPDRPAGRGRGLTPTPISSAAQEMGLPLLRTDDINRETLPPADVMVVIAFGQKLSQDVVNRPRLGSVNLHASRVPKYRGAAPINWAILNGEKTTGNSVIRLAEKMDAGAVLAQSELMIGDVETAGELHDRLAVDGAGLVLRAIEDLSTERAIETPQDHSQASLAPKLIRETARLDWSRSAEELARQIRGLFPWPACRVKLCDAEGGVLDTLRLARARAGDSDETQRWQPGEVMSDGRLATGAGALEVLECQPDSKRLMTLDDYRRGHRWHAGLKLISAV